MSNIVAIQIKDLVANYGGPNILKGISVNFYEQEIACIIGPNGAGKSTLLRAIFHTKVKIKQGGVSFYGRNIIGYRPEELLKIGISFLPQGHSIFPAMTVRENLEMGAFIRKDKDVKQDIDEILDRFPLLKEKESKMAGDLSGGQQKMLEMGRALLLRPQVMLLDEPSLGLAPQIRHEVFEEIKRLGQNLTVILVEQNAKMALEISDHAIVLELGKKRFEGTGKEIISNEKVKKLYLGGT